MTRTINTRNAAANYYRAVEALVAPEARADFRNHVSVIIDQEAEWFPRRPRWILALGILDEQVARLLGETTRSPLTEASVDEGAFLTTPVNSTDYSKARAFLRSQGRHKAAKALDDTVTGW